jgi:hypothetical protein
MKNCEVALSTTFVRAMVIVPRSFLSPLAASFLIGGRVGSLHVGVIPRPGCDP